MANAVLDLSLIHILVMGIGIDNLPIYGDITISGLAIAAIAGVIMNKVLPEEI